MKSAATTESRLDSALPEYHSEPAERLGREGMVTVWDDLGRYVGCMGVNLWRHLLTVSGGPVDDASCCPSFAAGYGVHYSNCPNHDPVEDASRLPAAEAELERRTSSAAKWWPPGFGRVLLTWAVGSAIGVLIALAVWGVK